MPERTVKVIYNVGIITPFLMFYLFACVFVYFQCAFVYFQCAFVCFPSLHCCHKTFAINTFEYAVRN